MCVITVYFDSSGAGDGFFQAQRVLAAAGARRFSCVRAPLPIALAPELLKSVKVRKRSASTVTFERQWHPLPL